MRCSLKKTTEEGYPLFTVCKHEPPEIAYIPRSDIYSRSSTLGTVARMKGSVALLAGALPVIVSCSHALPPVREISHARSTPPRTASASETAFVVTPNSFPNPSLGVSGRSSSRRNAPRRTRPRIVAFVPPLQCAATHKRPWAGAVSFGSSSVAGVEGAFEAAAAAGLDRDPIARGVGVDGGVGAPAEAAAGSGDDETSLDAFGSAVASCAVVDEGGLICQKLEGVISRQAEVAEQEVLLRVAHLDDYFAIAGEYIRRFHRPLPWSWELICRQLEEVVSQEAQVAEEQILLRMANLDDFFAVSCEYVCRCPCEIFSVNAAQSMGPMLKSYPCLQARRVSMP